MKDVKIEKVETLSDRWASLKKYTILYPGTTAAEQTLVREVHDHGNGAAVLPYDAARGTGVCWFASSACRPSQRP